MNESLMRRVLAAAGVALLLGGCAGVEPWDRDVLARPEMQIVSDPDRGSGRRSHLFQQGSVERRPRLRRRRLRMQLKKRKAPGFRQIGAPLAAATCALLGQAVPQAGRSRRSSCRGTSTRRS